MIWAGFAAKHGAVTVTQGFLLKGKQESGGKGKGRERVGC
jgi:hypothetical protein